MTTLTSPQAHLAVAHVADLAMNPQLTHKLDIAFEGSEVAFFNVSEESGDLELFVEVLSLPETGPMGDDPRRIVKFKNASSFRALVRQKADPERKDWKELVTLRLRDIQELNGLIASLQVKDDMTNWRHFDAPIRTEDWPSEISLETALSGDGDEHSFWWGFEGWQEGAWPRGRMFLEGEIRFEGVEVFRAGREPLAVEQFADDGLRWWHDMFRHEGRSHGIELGSPRWSWTSN